ncbi:MAG: hypothetical protein KatS3mg010_0686 [Acidimicrobiia bacterium]|nr:MAG: hypothetical protein KatS3mg010_0686 [Acidimicrobiia bacterium]
MTTKAERDSADDPAASPSRPSVKLTAFDIAYTTNTAQSTQPTSPKSKPSGRVNDRLVETSTQSIAITANTTETATIPTVFPRFRRPRFRRWRTDR